MAYGDEKIKEMSRSILPSKNRDTARKERRRISRGARRASKMILKTADFEEEDDLDIIEMDRDRDIHDMVFSRRDGDKVAPVMRWAKNIVKDVPKEDRTTFMASKLPDNLIGQHALSHIKNLEEFPRNELQFNSTKYRNGKSKIPPMELDVFLRKIEQDYRLLDLLNKEYLSPKIYRTFSILTLQVEKRRLKEIKIDPITNLRTEIWESYFVNEKVGYQVSFPGLQLKNVDAFIEELNVLVQARKKRLNQSRNKGFDELHETEIVEKLEQQNPSLKGRLKSEDRYHQLYTDTVELHNFNAFVAAYFDCFGDWQKIKKYKRPDYWVQLSWKFKELY